MATNWWEDLPDADAPAPSGQEPVTPEPQAPAQQGAAPAGQDPAGGQWWADLPDAEPEASPFEQRLRASPAAGMNPYAEPTQPQQPRPLDPSVRLPPTITEDQFPALRDMATVQADGDRFVQARRRGIEVGGAPDELRAAYVKLPPNTRNELAGYMVNSYFAQQGFDQKVPVTYDQQMKTHLFKDPRDGKMRPLNDIGMDWEDAKEFMKYAVAPALGAMGAGAAGTVTGSPFVGAIAALAADTAIAGGFRTNDVLELINDGLVHPEDLSPAAEGSKEALWALGGSAAGGIGGYGARRIIGGIDRAPMSVDVDRKTLSTLMERYDAKYGDTIDDLPLDKRMALAAETPKEKAAALRVQSRREALEASSSSKKYVLERSEQNKADLQEGLQRFTQTIGMEENPDVYRASGISLDGLLNSQQRIIDNLEAPARRELARYDQAVTDAYQESKRLADEILEDAADPRRMPAEFKGVFDAAERNFRENMAEQYESIASATRGQAVFDIKPLEAELNSLRKRAMEDARFRNLIFGEDTRGLAPRQDISLGAGPEEAITREEVSDVIFGQAFRKDRSGLLLSDAAKREMADDTVFDYKAVNSALMNVRERIRDLPRNAGTGTTSQLSRIEKALEEVRLSGLKQIDEGLADQQQALDTTYRLGKEALDRGIGRKLADQYLEPRPGMDGLLLPSTFDKLFQGDAGAATIRDIRTLSDMDVVTSGSSSPIDMLGVRDNIRRGLLGALRNRTGTYGAKGGQQAPVISPENFEKFKTDYRDALEYVFPPEQIEKMQNFASMRRAMESAEADVKAVKERVMQFPWGNDSIIDKPAVLMSRTWPTGREDTTKALNSRQLRQAFREQGDPPGLLEDYRKLIAQDMMAKNSDRMNNLDPHKLGRYIERNQELLEEWYTSKGQSGAEVVRGLKSYVDIGKAITEESGLQLGDKQVLLSVLNGASRAYVGIFTPAGRVLTALKQMAGGASVSKETDFILNPDKYIKNEDFYDVLNSPGFRALMRGSGHEVINSLRGELEAREAQYYD